MICGNYETLQIKEMSERLAIELFTTNVKKIIGGYAALMGGLDLIVFTGGIGEHDVRTSLEVCDGLDFFGARIDVKE